MECYYESPETHYGVDDLFPSHGYRQWWCELTEDDRDEVREQILDSMKDAEDYLEKVNVTIYCKIADRHFDFEVETSDWFNENEIEALRRKYGR